jgi:hypothetical protein
MTPAHLHPPAAQARTEIQRPAYFFWLKIELYITRLEATDITAKTEKALAAGAELPEGRRLSIQAMNLFFASAVPAGAAGAAVAAAEAAQAGTAMAQTARPDSADTEDKAAIPTSAASADKAVHPITMAEAEAVPVSAEAQPGASETTETTEASEASEAVTAGTAGKAGTV